MLLVKLFVLALPLALGGLPQMVQAAEGGAPLVHEGIVEAELPEVWAAFTTKEGVESWMAPHAEVTLEIGGSMRTVYDPKAKVGDPSTIENTYLCFDPMRMLAFHVTRFPEGFPFPNAVKRMWTVIYFDRAEPGKTRIRIVGLGFTQDEESQKMRKFFEAGNAQTLKELQQRFAPKPKGN